MSDQIIVTDDSNTHHLPTSHFLPLDDEEAALISTIESDSDWTPMIKIEQDAFGKVLQNAAKNTLKKSKPISLRLNQQVLQKLKERAQQVGVSYQTILNSLATQYVNGSIKLTI